MHTSPRRKITQAELDKLLASHNDNGLGHRASPSDQNPFVNLDCDGLSLAGDDLSHANFVNCSFDGADFSNANLTGASCADCSFDAAELTNANLSYASFKECGDIPLEGAHLQSTVFNGEMTPAEIFPPVPKSLRDDPAVQAYSAALRLPDAWGTKQYLLKQASHDIVDLVEKTPDDKQNNTFVDKLTTISTLKSTESDSNSARVTPEPFSNAKSQILRFLAENIDGGALPNVRLQSAQLALESRKSEGAAANKALIDALHDFSNDDPNKRPSPLDLITVAVNSANSAEDAARDPTAVHRLRSLAIEQVDQLSARFVSNETDLKREDMPAVGRGGIEFDQQETTSKLLAFDDLGRYAAYSIGDEHQAAWRKRVLDVSERNGEIAGATVADATKTPIDAIPDVPGVPSKPSWNVHLATALSMSLEEKPNNKAILDQIALAEGSEVAPNKGGNLLDQATGDERLIDAVNKMKSGISADSKPSKADVGFAAAYLAIAENQQGIEPKTVLADKRLTATVEEVQTTLDGAYQKRMNNRDSKDVAVVSLAYVERHRLAEVIVDLKEAGLDKSTIADWRVVKDEADTARTFSNKHAPYRDLAQKREHVAEIYQQVGNAYAEVIVDKKGQDQKERDRERDADGLTARQRRNKSRFATGKQMSQTLTTMLVGGGLNRIVRVTDQIVQMGHHR
jgi:hypothetical protein